MQYMLDSSEQAKEQCKTACFEQLINSNSVFSDSKNMNKFHDVLTMVKTPISSAATPLLSADGSTLLTRKMLSWKG